MSLPPDRPNGAGFVPPPSYEQSQGKASESPTPTTGTDEMGREVKSLSSNDVKPQQGLRAKSGDSVAPKTKIADRHIQGFSLGQKIVKLLIFIKELIIKPPAPRTDTPAGELFSDIAREAAKPEAEPAVQLGGRRPRIRSSELRYDAKNLTVQTSGEKPAPLSEVLPKSSQQNEQYVVRNINFSNTRFDVQDLSNIKFVDCLFDKADLEGCQLDNSQFSACHFKKTNLQNITGTNVRFDHCEIDRTTFDHSQLTAPSFEDTTITSTSFSQSLISQPKIHDGITGSLKHCNFTGATITGGSTPNLINGNNEFDGATLNNLNLKRLRYSSKLSYATLNNVISDSSGVFAGCRIAGMKVTGGQINFGSPTDWPGVHAELYGCHFNGTKVLANDQRVNIRGGTFKNADMSGQVFHKSDWQGVGFDKNCNLRGLKTSFMEISGCGFQGCDMRENLHSGSAFRRCHFVGNDLAGTRFKIAPNTFTGTLSDTTFEESRDLPRSWFYEGSKGVNMHNVKLKNCTAPDGKLVNNKTLHN